MFIIAQFINWLAARVSRVILPTAWGDSLQNNGREGDAPTHERPLFIVATTHAHDTILHILVFFSFRMDTFHKKNVLLFTHYTYGRPLYFQ